MRLLFLFYFTAAVFRGVEVDGGGGAGFQGADRSRSGFVPGVLLWLVVAGLIPQNSSLMGNQAESKRSCGDLIGAAGGRRGRRSAACQDRNTQEYTGSTDCTVLQFFGC